MIEDIPGCAHENFGATVDVARIIAPNGGKMAFSATIKIVCAKCLVPFEFLGLQAGDSPAEPLVSVDRLELRAPITPQGQEPNLNLPGYRINIGGPGGGPVS